jgi:hypothetical protein
MQGNGGPSSGLLAPVGAAAQRLSEGPARAGRLLEAERRAVGDAKAKAEDVLQYTALVVAAG